MTLNRSVCTQSQVFELENSNASLAFFSTKYGGQGRVRNSNRSSVIVFIRFLFKNQQKNSLGMRIWILSYNVVVGLYRQILNKFKSVFYIAGLCFFLFSGIQTTTAQKSRNRTDKNDFTSELIFPVQSLHVHSSSIVELPNGDLLSCWFEGSGERSANDVLVKGARLKKGESKWSIPFILADTPGQPDCNPVLFVDKNEQLILYWIVVQANRWENSILKYKVSSDFNKTGAPVWRWQDIILLKPGDDFAETIKSGFKELKMPGFAWAEYAPPYERMIYEAAKDPKKRETGWMTRIHPVSLLNGRILLPLYSDGYNLSLMAISDDQGNTWVPSLPLVGRGNVQPAVIQKKDGSLIAFMRDNGDEPGRIMISISKDNGYTWSTAKKTGIPNPGASVEAIALKNGDWVLIYNNMEDGRNRLVISLSDDEGKTWKWTRTIEEREPGKGSFSYPSIIQSKDGLIHATFSYHLNKERSIKHVAFPPNWIKKN